MPASAAVDAFDRPVFILSSPRSCSTLLFETISQSGRLWTIGDESHRLFDSHPELRLGAPGVDSNRWDSALATAGLARRLRGSFLSACRNAHGVRGVDAAPGQLRLLDKNPQNALRIPLLETVFPGARYIYLYREPRANISSMIDAWRSGRFVTYPQIRTTHGPWSLLLPPGWQQRLDWSLARIAAWQFDSANSHIVDALATLPPERWIALDAGQFLADPALQTARLLRFIGIASDAGLDARLARALPFSAYTLTPPMQDKWRRNVGEVEEVLPAVLGTVNRVQALVDSQLAPLEPVWAEERGSATSQWHAARAMRSPMRNGVCPCGSGLRYKACHGRVV
jgi:hypothetical protein